MPGAGYGVEHVDEIQSFFFKKKQTIIPDMMVKRDMEYDLLFLLDILFLNQFLINTISVSMVSFFLLQQLLDIPC